MNSQLHGSNLLKTPQPGNRDVMHYMQGDPPGEPKVKILTPIQRGRSTNLFEEFATAPNSTLSPFLAGEKQKNGWKCRIVISDWMRIGQGHAWLIEPDGFAGCRPGLIAHCLTGQLLVSRLTSRTT